MKTKVNVVKLADVTNILAYASGEVIEGQTPVTEELKLSAPQLDLLFSLFSSACVEIEQTEKKVNEDTPVKIIARFIEAQAEKGALKSEIFKHLLEKNPNADVFALTATIQRCVPTHIEKDHFKVVRVKDRYYKAGFEPKTEEPKKGDETPKTDKPKGGKK